MLFRISLSFWTSAEGQGFAVASPKKDTVVGHSVGGRGVGSKYVCKKRVSRKESEKKYYLTHAHRDRGEPTRTFSPEFSKTVFLLADSDMIWVFFIISCVL